MKQNNAYKKGLLVLVFSFFAVTGALAQFSLGFDLQLPMGTFGDAYNMGLGGTVRYDAAINDNLSWTASAGYISYGGKNLPSGYSSTISMIPIVGGIKYYFTESNAGFYGAADIGFFITSASYDIPGFGSGSTSETKFGLTPGVGYRFGQFDVSGRYNIVGDFNNVGFRIAYFFGAD